MEYRSDTHRGVGLNDIKHQSTPHTGAILLAKLQQKVARLEITLRDKEAEFSKVQSSLKNTQIHELKLQTEVYYQEILRLKNELNLLQENKHSLEEALPERASKKNTSHPSNGSKTLVKSIERLKDENERLSCQLSVIQLEKERLESDFDKILRQTKEEELKNKMDVCAEGMTQTSPDHDQASTLTNAEKTESALSELKSQIEELRRKEQAWEEEKSMFKELIFSLKEDRVFFKDTSQKRHDELWALQKELVKLQKDIGGFQLNGKPLCKQCTKLPSRTGKSPKKISIREVSSSHSSQQSSSSASGGGKPPKPKTSSVVSTKRLPTPQKSSRREGYRSTVSKSSLPSTSSSRSSSTQSSPSHLPTKKYSQGSTKLSSVSSAKSSFRDNSSGQLSESSSSDRKTISSPSSSSKRNPSTLISAAPHSQEDVEDEIAREILKDLDFTDVFNGHCTENRDTGLPSSQSSPGLDEVSRKIDDREEFPKESGCSDSQEAEQDELLVSVNEKLNDGAEKLLTLLECHFSRKKKLEALKPKQKQNSLPKTNSPSKSSPKVSSAKPVAKSTPSKSPVKGNANPSVRSIPKSPPKRPVSAPKKSPPKPEIKPRKNSFDRDGSDQPQNLKDIDLMICLLESHVARKAFLSLKCEK